MIYYVYTLDVECTEIDHSSSDYFHIYEINTCLYELVNLLHF